MTNFTPEDLLLYLYKETTAVETVAIEAALKQDWTLREKLEVLKSDTTSYVNQLDAELNSLNKQVTALNSRVAAKEA